MTELECVINEILATDDVVISFDIIEGLDSPLKIRIQAVDCNTNYSKRQEKKIGEFIMCTNDVKVKTRTHPCTNLHISSIVITSSIA